MSSQHQRDSQLRIVLIVLAAIVLFPLLMMVFAMPMMGMMGWWWGGSGGGPGMGLSPFWGIGMMLLFLVVLLGVGYFLYRGLIGGQVRSHDRALEELRTAYARGDLSDEEYEQRLERLQHDPD